MHNAPMTNTESRCCDCRAPLTGDEYIVDTCEDCRLYYATRETDTVGPTKSVLRAAYFARVEANKPCAECSGTGRQPDSPYPCAFCAPNPTPGAAADYRGGSGFGNYLGD